MIKPILDDLLRPLLVTPHPDEALIRALMELIAHDEIVDCTAAAAALGVSTHTLRRISLRYFGLNAKLLLVRARFLRSFMKVFRVSDFIDYSLIDDSYHDVPHFLRDARMFLGMTPRQFMKLGTPFLDGSVRARAEVLGNATQALHRIPVKASQSSPG